MTSYHIQTITPGGTTELPLADGSGLEIRRAVSAASTAEWLADTPADTAPAWPYGTQVAIIRKTAGQPDERLFRGSVTSARHVFAGDAEAIQYTAHDAWWNLEREIFKSDRNIIKITVLAGGTPCQSFSTAGKRKGLADPRGGLMLAFTRLAHESRAEWLLWENVPGVLHSERGRAFAALLGALTLQRVEPPAKGWRNSGVCHGPPGGYSVAWRVLDASVTRASGFPRAVAQRRRRVWLVGRLGADWQRPARVLFDGAVNPQYRPAGGCHEAPAPGVGDLDHHPPISIGGAFNISPGLRRLFCSTSVWRYRATSTILCGGPQFVVTPEGIRRIMPVEEERLFGFPDGWTDITYRDKPASPNARHNVLANSWAVNCARWVCERINMSIAGTLK